MENFGRRGIEGFSVAIVELSFLLLSRAVNVDKDSRTSSGDGRDWIIGFGGLRLFVRKTSLNQQDIEAAVEEVDMDIDLQLVLLFEAACICREGYGQSLLLLLKTPNPLAFEFTTEQDTAFIFIFGLHCWRGRRCPRVATNILLMVSFW